MRIAVAEGPITADDLLADWLVVTEEARLTIDGRGDSSPSVRLGMTPACHPERSEGAPADARLLGAVVWRLGAGAYRRYLLGELDAHAVADGVFELGTRSNLALDVAAELLPRRGGDALERAAFALLFAAGEPQEGLAAFLEKRAPRFR